MLLPTTLVGSYAQPEWLIDRAKLAGRFPPRVRAKELWRIAEPYLAEAQDDATIARDPRAGRRRPRHHHRRRDPSRELFEPLRDRARRHRHRQAGHRARPFGPSQSGAAHRRPDPPQATGRSRRSQIPARPYGPQGQDDRARPLHHEPAGAERLLPIAAEAALAYAEAVNEEIKDLFAAGADIVQIDEPYMQARPGQAADYGLAALNRALEGVNGMTAVHICFGYAAIIHQRPSAYSFLPQLKGCRCRQISIETAQSNLDCSVLEELPDQTIILGVLDLSTPRSKRRRQSRPGSAARLATASPRTSSSPRTAASNICRARRLTAR